ncbi:MAG: FAD-dependent monooxygenase [Achromobacter sp.]|uniref:FAD-dependent monooxygenase n=1 Tax=Achromobacter sp. TaxID=134375 RepID=UPI0029AEE3E3|nr:FAD-dependent monooxygenase [Achromobacter sp.]MDX3985753.1 FAD-dependent monooxygenase [Achromobacter sp.]
MARLGIRSVIFYAELQVSEGSRAIVLTRRSMEILQQVGVAADRVLESRLLWRFGKRFHRGRWVVRMEAEHSTDDSFPPMINIQQQYLEGHPQVACATNPMIDIWFGNRCATGAPRG